MRSFGLVGVQEPESGGDDSTIFVAQYIDDITLAVPAKAVLVLEYTVAVEMAAKEQGAPCWSGLELNIAKSLVWDPVGVEPAEKSGGEAGSPPPGGGESVVMQV